MDIMTELRAAIKTEVFDYQILMHHLRAYKKPRDKLTSLLKGGFIIQIKRGLYVFNPSMRTSLLSLEVISAMLVQPSYISREYALQIYGLLPERVERVTCMTTRKKRHYETPIGQFDYYSLNYEKFGIGVEAKEVPLQGGYLLATKEKALADWVASLPSISDRQALEFLLYQEARIEEGSLFPLNTPLLEEIATVYHNKNVDLLLTL
jgi:hypothetical protein